MEKIDGRSIEGKVAYILDWINAHDEREVGQAEASQPLCLKCSKPCKQEIGLTITKCTDYVPIEPETSTIEQEANVNAGIITENDIIAYVLDNGGKISFKTTKGAISDVYVEKAIEPIKLNLAPSITQKLEAGMTEGFGGLWYVDEDRKSVV